MVECWMCECCVCLTMFCMVACKIANKTAASPCRHVLLTKEFDKSVGVATSNKKPKSHMQGTMHKHQLHCYAIFYIFETKSMKHRKAITARPHFMADSGNVRGNNKRKQLFQMEFHVRLLTWSPIRGVANNNYYNIWVNNDFDIKSNSEYCMQTALVTARRNNVRCKSKRMESKTALHQTIKWTQKWKML